MLPSKYFKELLRHEGGYVNDPLDAGGETKYGISKRAFPSADIKSLTEEGACILYSTKYWKPLEDTLVGVSDAVLYAMFDFAVNSGHRQAYKSLQRGLFVIVDGQIGPDTLAAMKKKTDVELINMICDQRRGFIRDLVAAGKLAPKFQMGILKRIEEVRIYAML